MSLLRPSVLLTVDGRTVSSAQAGLVRLVVSLAVNRGHDRAEIALWPSSRLAGTAVGTPLAIAMGVPGQEVAVWSGEVVAVAAAADAVMLEGLAPTAALSLRRVAQTYLDQPVAEIVRDLAGAPGLALDEVSGDLQLAAYSVDGRRPAWSHLLDLARLTGGEVGASARGGLRFVPVRTGSADLELRHGAEILSWSAGPARRLDPPAIAAYGAASEAGPEQWHWLLRQPVPASTDASGSGASFFVPAALRTRMAAQAMSLGLAAAAGRAAFGGALRIAGRPEVRPGNLLRLSGLPPPAGGAPVTVRALEVEHSLDARQGFLSRLAVEGAGEEAA
jgi:hypothetical protein